MQLSDHEQLAAILHINNAAIEQRTREGLFTEIARQLDALFHYDRFSILLQDSADVMWHYFVPGSGVALPGIAGNELPVRPGMVPYEAMRTRRTVLFDVHDDSGRPGNEYLVDAGLRAIVCVPMIMRGRVLGTVQLSYSHPMPLNQEQIMFLEKITRQLALCVDTMLTREALESKTSALNEEKDYLMREIASQTSADEVVFVSAAMKQVMDDVHSVAATDATVLLTGETGTGKDLLARTIHRRSRRSERALFKVNCAALVPTLIESELFGHEKGAFTGASERKIGRFELADNSTLFLDEISELPLNTQAKLLQVLQDQRFERVGGTRTITSNVRIIAATNQDLRLLVNEHAFRADLYYRLNIFPLHVPPLRERPEDLVLLLETFIRRACARMQKQPPRISRSLVLALQNYSWPGNIRELENLVERIVILKSNREVGPDDVRFLQMHAEPVDDDVLGMDAAQKRHIERVLRMTSGQVGGEAGAARALGLKKSTLQYRMKRLGVRASDFKG
jgi:formate hydrogenlyase transcriptional activator